MTCKPVERNMIQANPGRHGQYDLPSEKAATRERTGCVRNFRASPNLVAFYFPVCWNYLMNKWLLFFLCMLSGTALPPLQAGENGSNIPDGLKERIDCSVYGESPHVAPAYFSGTIRKRDTWEIDILSLNGHKLPVPITVAFERKSVEFTPATGMGCSGIIPVLIPRGKAGYPKHWRDAGTSPAVIVEDKPRNLYLLQEAVLQSYQHHLIKSMKMSIILLEQMKDEKQALALEKNWAYEIMDYVFWTSLENSVPLEARMAYIKNHPSVPEQSQKEAEAYLERMRVLRSKPWSAKLRLLQDEKNGFRPLQGNF